MTEKKVKEGGLTTNGLVERKNNRIKNIKTMDYDYRNEGLAARVDKHPNL